jgi:predicted RNase H-like nuclease (RuvC/YqgF family)
MRKTNQNLVRDSSISLIRLEPEDEELSKSIKQLEKQASQLGTKIQKYRDSVPLTAEKFILRDIQSESNLDVEPKKSTPKKRKEPSLVDDAILENFETNFKETVQLLGEVNENLSKTIERSRNISNVLEDQLASSPNSVEETLNKEKKKSTTKATTTPRKKLRRKLASKN